VYIAQFHKTTKW